MLAGLVANMLAAPDAAAGQLSSPEIRSSPQNHVPDCVTPERLMAYLRSRNDRLAPRFAGIAEWYLHHGTAWRIRWDYAFFQMALETNFLRFERGRGRPGDVRADQNNFAGIGATGGGVAGERFADVETGVLAQMQHLVAYSGERLDAPVARRTRLKQDDIIALSQRLARPVRFSDLARRWATDPYYGRSIERLATEFRTGFCATQAPGASRLPDMAARGLTAPAEDFPWRQAPGAMAP